MDNQYMRSEDRGIRHADELDLEASPTKSTGDEVSPDSSNASSSKKHMIEALLIEKDDFKCKVYFEAESVDYE